MTNVRLQRCAQANTCKEFKDGETEKTALNGQ